MVFLHDPLDTTLGSHIDLLRLEVRALGTHAARSIHGLLERVALPAKDVVGMLAQAGVVACAEIKGLRAICRPVVGIIKGCRVPDHLVHQLRDAHGMSRGTFTTQTQEGGWP